MRFKLDENLGHRGAEILAQAGHDAATVAQQGLNSATDDLLIERCAAEQRCLVTLDLDFSNPIKYRPSRYSGICVLRLPRKPSQNHLLLAMQTLAAHLKTNEVSGRLWIVEIGRVREHEVPIEDDPFYNGPEWTEFPLPR